jgi:hypothetical protein
MEWPQVVMVVASLAFQAGMLWMFLRWLERN